MLRCRDVAGLGSEIIDHRIRWYRFDVWLHLAICDGCRRLLRQLRLTRDLMAYSRNRDAASEEVARIMKILPLEDSERT